MTTMKISLFSLAPFALFSAVAAQFNSTGPPFDQCVVTEYYADLFQLESDTLLWSRDDVAFLVSKYSHRNKLDNIAPVRGDDDILMALADLFPGDDDESVHLLYRDISFPAVGAGNPQSWVREDLWPIERGARRDSFALTDVHFKAPADYSVLFKKDQLFFGRCGIVEDDARCKRPATSETAEDTEQDDKVFAPPEKFRGDVARALFYGELRYSDELGLKLTDCPPFGDGEFGYLSELLRWHEEDPVSDEERARNDRACSRWQGNRNPFVDFPQLVEKYFGEPDTIIPNTNVYSKCTKPTNAPTATPNPCSSLQAGDIPIFLLNSDQPDQMVFFPLSDIPASVENLYVTDKAWTGTEFAEGEGTMTLEIPEGGIRAGQAFGFGGGGEQILADRWTKEGLFDLSVNGDQVFIYCLDADDLPNILWGFSNNGPWSEAGLEEYGPGESALPDSLADLGSNALPHADNCVYSGLLSGRKTELQKAFMDTASWNCLDESRIEVLNDSFDTGPSSSWMLSTVLASVLALAASFIALA